MIKKTIAIILILFCCFSFVIAENGDNGKEGRPLEVVYPGIPDEPVPTETDIGLEAYIVYVFQLVIALVGVAFFGLLLYNGIKYMLSSGDPTKSGEAMTGIKAAFLGATILLFSVGILNTIDESFLTIEVKEIEEIGPFMFSPGVYVCNFVISNSEIQEIINKYKSREERPEAIKEFRERIIKEREDEEDITKGCMRVRGCVTFADPIESGKNTYFVLPEIKSEREDKEEDSEESVISEEFEENHGIIAFNLEDGIKSSTEKEGGSCRLVIGNPGSGVPGNPPGHTLGWPAPIRSVCEVRIHRSEEHKGITFYKGFSFNDSIGKNMATERSPNNLATAPFLIPSGETGVTDIERGEFDQGGAATEDEEDRFMCTETKSGLFADSKEVCGVRSVKMDSNMFAVFLEDWEEGLKTQSTCTIIEDNHEDLTKIISSYSDTEEKEEGFMNMIYFDKIKVLQGNIVR